MRLVLWDIDGTLLDSAGHGREEQREYFTLDAHEWIEDIEMWVGLRTIAMVKAT